MIAMPSAVSPNPPLGPGQPDDLDRMLDYENAVDDFLNDIPARGSNPQAVQEPPRDEDQEVQVKRKRIPIPKLDEDRLLSDAGLPRLRKITKKRLKFRGKHHEFGDIANLLNTYQLWLDDLYPRAKFRDALTMVEKLGHTKRMQVMRKAWLDSTKPNRIDSTHNEDGPIAEEEEQSNRAEEQGERGTDQRGPSTTEVSTMIASNAEHENRSQGGDAPADDELDALFAENAGNQTAYNESDGDELDALLAENDGSQPRQAAISRKKLPFEDDDEDDLDALLAEQESGGHSAPTSGHNQPRPTDTNHDFADEEQAMAEMGGIW